MSAFKKKKKTAAKEDKQVQEDTTEIKVEAKSEANDTCETPDVEATDTASEEAAETVPSAEEELREQLKQLQERYQRLGAEYMNYQKRSNRLTEQAGDTARENVIRALLPVLDNFGHTLEQAGEGVDIVVLMQGVQIVYDHLLTVLKGLGMNMVAVKPGCEFDPSKHEAMCHEESEEVEANTVLRELARGYLFNERTLRPAKVAIAKAPSTEETEPEEEQVAADEADQDEESD